jgi:signal transduction histidine kinase
MSIPSRLVTYSRRRLGSAVPILAAAALLAAGGIAAGAQPADDAGPVVVFLAGEDPETPYVQGVLAGFRARLAQEPAAVLYVEYEDLLRFDTQEQRDWIAEVLTLKFRDRRPDAVAAIGSGVVDVLATRLRSAWADVPVIYLSMGETLPQAAPMPEATALVLENPIPEMFGAIRTLLPKTRRLGIVYGASPVERSRGQWYQGLVAAAGFEVLDLGGLTVDDLRAKVGTLPDDVALFVESLTVDGAGRVIPVTDSCRLVHDAANRPMFMMGRIRLGCGIVGGPLIDFAQAGRALAELALARAAGGPPGTVVLPLHEYVHPVFDARELQRWGIPESRLPAGSQVLYRAASVWRDYRREALLAIAVAAALNAIAVGLVLEQRWRRDAERALTTSYEEAHDLARRLISARDVERAQIARVLSSELGENVAAVARDAERIRQTLVPAATGIELAEAVSRRAAAIAGELDDWSQRLHPATLDTVGLTAALRGLCEEVSRGGVVAVEFRQAGDDSHLTGAVKLCLFRIAQEGLQNVRKHSGAGRAAVTLRVEPARVTLQVVDNGQGMPTGAWANGLGLISMRERASLVGGALDIRSRRGRGTTISVRIPITPA